LNNFYEAQRQVSGFYVSELSEWVTTKKDVLIDLLIACGVIIVLALVFLLPFYVLVNHAQKEILTIFLEIPICKAKKLFQVSENFVN
jgi:hypothetical protein